VLGAALGLVSLFAAGLLAGEEFVIRFGVRGPLASLDLDAHILFRQALIRRLRVLVPAIFLVAFLSGAALSVLTGDPFDIIGVAALAGFISITLGGTVPINQAVLRWNPVLPPPDWHAVIVRWERLDTTRTAAAVLAFVFFLLPVTLHPAGPSYLR
jgi:hypothetical protein